MILSWRFDCKGKSSCFVLFFFFSQTYVTLATRFCEFEKQSRPND